MSTLRVNVKWGKEKFENIEVDLNESPVQFKAQLFTLTGVPPTRQKILCRGKNLKPDTWDEFPVQEGSLIMLLGTAEELVEPPVSNVQPTFLEDMTPDQINTAICLKSGLKNLGILLLAILHMQRFILQQLHSLIYKHSLGVFFNLFT
ncbi:Ubiquitin carboxyl-terminal hydrolase 14 [Trichinella zimbabwensis]|uniref:Ubiquitin carboxyl-terminal hydrolase 14 n=1 Tax=Trichinella zimbabwensis TaxID=268475 RepID=A0A0V1GNH8_9BILA|nr:Ubiquitin carboxyl-terminal hydrolase 14 [Trichinella zimbabwensis]